MFWKKYQLLILFGVGLAIRIFSLFPSWVEQWYSQGLYPVVSIVQRFLFGWIPFSFGDIVYGSAVIYLIVSLYNFICTLIKRKVNRGYLYGAAKKIVLIALWIYVLFNICWGLNYNRLGIARQLGLEVTPYTTEELTTLVNATIDKLLELDTIGIQHRDALGRKRNLFSAAVGAYDNVRTQWDFLTYKRPSVKPSLYSYLGNYMGYTGYYNPFTGEAQVNTTVPLTQTPFTTCHEIGHQLGFAREMEANFAGFLSARVSDDPAVRYSVYFDLYIYASRNLLIRDSALARSLHQRVPAIARKDLRDLRDFYKKYENPFEPIIRMLYGQYLKANEQPQGILSYDEVVAWVIAYQRKYGSI
ncbi:MAG TPA: DUF3810 domain-containing protein [Chitinophagaceae bacterium]